MEIHMEPRKGEFWVITCGQEKTVVATGLGSAVNGPSANFDEVTCSAVARNALQGLQELSFLLQEGEQAGQGFMDALQGITHRFDCYSDGVPSLPGKLGKCKLYSKGALLGQRIRNCLNHPSEKKLRKLPPGD